MSQELSSAIGLIAGIIALTGFVPYIISIVRKKTSPNRASWMIWVVSGIFNVVAYYGVGGREAIWVPLSFVAGPLIIFLLSIRYGEGGWTKLDRFFLAAALITSIPLLFQLPGWTLACMIILDFCGLPSTWAKTYKHPEKEDLTTWVLQSSGSALNLLAIQTWDLSQASLPLYVTFSTGSILFLILTRRGKTS